MLNELWNYQSSTSLRGTTKIPYNIMINHIRIYDIYVYLTA